jgi:hypothetical protein
MQVERGAIQNRERYSQGRDFSGMRFPNDITPSDMDGVLEFSDKLFIFMEFKYDNTPISYGQKLMLKRLADTVCAAGKVGISIICEHQQKANADILCHQAVVREYRYLLEWRKPKKRVTIYDMINFFYQKEVNPPNPNQ